MKCVAAVGTGSGLPRGWESGAGIAGVDEQQCATGQRYSEVEGAAGLDDFGSVTPRSPL